MENLVQLFNAESHAIGLKPVHAMELTMRLQNMFLTNLSKEMDMYMSLIILTEWLIQFSCDNTALMLKATVDSKLHYVYR